jgi:ribosomal protein L11 methylase PrmA
MWLLIISTVLYIILFWLFYTKFFGAEYCPVPTDSLKRMIEFSKLKKNETAYDLGSGDGKIVLSASKRCRKAVGIEIDPLRVLWSRLRAKGKNIEIFRENFFNHNLNDADVVFIFLRQKANDRLEKKFKKEMKKGSRIVSHYWKLGLKPYKTDDELRVYAYKI